MEQKQPRPPRRFVTYFSWRWWLVMAFYIGSSITFVYAYGLERSNWKWALYVLAVIFASYTGDQWEEQLVEKERHEKEQRHGVG